MDTPAPFGSGLLPPGPPDETVDERLARLAALVNDEDALSDEEIDRHLLRLLEVIHRTI